MHCSFIVINVILKFRLSFPVLLPCCNDRKVLFANCNHKVVGFAKIVLNLEKNKHFINSTQRKPNKGNQIVRNKPHFSVETFANTITLEEDL